MTNIHGSSMFLNNIIYVTVGATIEFIQLHDHTGLGIVTVLL